MATIVRGRSFEVTSAIEEYIVEKYKKLYKFSDHLNSLELILDGNSKKGFEVEVIAHYDSDRLVVKAENSDLYSAIDKAKLKIKALVQKQKITHVKV